MKLKNLIYLAAKNTLVVCSIMMLITVLLSWNNNTYIQESEYNSELKNIYKPNISKSTEEFFVRDEITEIVKEFNTWNFYKEVTNDSKISLVILNEARYQNVPINLAFAVAKVESNFNPNAINYNRNSKDYGLFQLNNSYRNWSTSDFFDIEKNTKEGIRYLKEMLELFDGDVLKAIAAYNAGPGRVINNKIPESTERYITKILVAEDELNVKFNNYLLNESIIINVRRMNGSKK